MNRSEEHKSKRPGWRFAILVALFSFPAAILLVLRFTVFQMFTIPATSGAPNLMVGDYILVSKTAYQNENPSRGDVAVFKLPNNPDVDYIKRIVGIPGDRIQVVNGRLVINGETLERTPVVYKGPDPEGQTLVYYRETLPNGRSYVISETSDEGGADNTEVYAVPPGHYFAMGDNRDNSQDSRYQDAVGYIPRQNFVGKLWLRLWNIKGVPMSGRPLETTAP